MKIFINVESGFISFPPHAVPVGNPDTILLRLPGTIMIFWVSHTPAGKYGCLSLGRRCAAMDGLPFEKDDTVFKRRC